MKIQYLYPKAQIYGTEQDKRKAKIASNNFPTICGEIESTVLPYEKKSFDYILIGDMEKIQNNIEEILDKLEVYLKEEGKIIKL